MGRERSAFLSTNSYVDKPHIQINKMKILSPLNHLLYSARADSFHWTLDHHLLIVEEVKMTEENELVEDTKIYHPVVLPAASQKLMASN